MKFPNKVIPYRESSIARFPVILDLIQKDPMTPSDLYRKVHPNKVNDLKEFVEILDCLFAMNKLQLDGEVLRYVD